MIIVSFKRKKKKKKRGWQKIPHWSAVYTARSDAQYHNCDECEGPILKGFQYEKEVFGITIKGKRTTLTFRKHVSPPCEFFLPPDDDDEKRDSDSKELDKAA